MPCAEDLVPRVVTATKPSPGGDLSPRHQSQDRAGEQTRGQAPWQPGPSLPSSFELQPLSQLPAGRGAHRGF